MVSSLMDSNGDTVQQLVLALESLLAQRQEYVLRLEGIAREQALLNQQLANLDVQQEALLKRLQEQVGAPAGSPLSRHDCASGESERR